RSGHDKARRAANAGWVILCPRVPQDPGASAPRCGDLVERTRVTASPFDAAWCQVVAGTRRGASTPLSDEGRVVRRRADVPRVRRHPAARHHAFEAALNRVSLKSGKPRQYRANRDMRKSLDSGTNTATEFACVPAAALEDVSGWSAARERPFAHVGGSAHGCSQ